MEILYNIVIRMYILAVYIASLLNNKAKQGLLGRKNILERIKKDVSKEKKVVWFHAASLGEFEQGRPIIDNYKKKISKS